jgi:hypothetical protein
MLIGTMQYYYNTTPADPPLQFVSSVLSTPTLSLISTKYEVTAAPLDDGRLHYIFTPPVEESIEVETIGT